MKRFAQYFTFHSGASMHKIERGLRLRHLIWACALLGVLITELIVLGGSYALWSAEQIKKLDEETLMMLRANIDAASFLSVDETIRMGDRISSFSDVRGGTIYNRMGEQVAAFGQSPPQLSMRTFQREGIRYLYSQNKTFLDIYYPTEITGLANPMIMRIDIRNMPTMLHQRLKEKATATFSVAFISALVIVVLLNLTIVRPILILRDAVLKATDNPDSAHSALLNWSRGDEFGEVSKALDMLFTTVSVVYQEDLSAWQEMRQHSAFPILTYDSSWRLINANTAALSFFNCATHSEIAERHASFIRQSDENGVTDISPKQLVGDSDILKTVNIVTPGGIKRCVLNAVAMHKRAGTVFRIVVELVDITKLAAQLETMKTDTAVMTSSNQTMKRRLAEMRALFQSCLILLSHTDDKAQQGVSSGQSAAIDSTGKTVTLAATRPVTLTDRIVNTWFFDARTNHLIDSKLVHDVLPPAYGRPEEIEAIFMQAFMAVYGQSAFEKPLIHIRTEKLESHKTLFEIWSEQPKEKAKAREPDETLAAGAKLSLASLQQSLKVVGGTFRGVQNGRIGFVLETAALEDVPFSKEGAASAEKQVESELKKILEL